MITEYSGIREVKREEAYNNLPLAKEPEQPHIEMAHKMASELNERFNLTDQNAAILFIVEHLKKLRTTWADELKNKAEEIEHSLKALNSIIPR